VTYRANPPRSCGNASDARNAYAIAYDACTEIANFKKQSGIRRLRYVDNPRGVSSHHVLFRAFGDALCRRENVRHATFCYPLLGAAALVEFKGWKNRD